MSNNNKKIMISYGRKDAEIFAQELKDFLVGQGHKVWIDKSKEEDSGIRGGSVWETEIEEAIKDNNIVIAILSPHAIRRPDGVCLDEISMARFEKKFIIPLMYKEVKPPLCIYRLDWIDFLRSETQISIKDSGLKKLSRSIENNKLDYEGKNKAFSALKSINFDYRLTGLRQEFIGRRWIYDTENPNSESLIECWLKSEKNILLILGDPGVGKSAISAHLIEKHPACIAYHFCISDDEDTLNPNKFIKSIAHQLATQLDDSYSDQVLEEMSELPESSVSLFNTLISNPVSQLANTDKKYFIVIDGLDEASKNGSDNKLLKLFSTKFIDALPGHIRFIFTSRRNRDIESRFAIHSPFKVETTEENNMSDMKEYILAMLDKHKISMSTDDVGILIEKSEGSILYLKEIIRQARNSEDKTIDVESLPKGLDGIYLEFFDNSFEDYSPFREILSVLVATYSSVTLTLLEIIMSQENLKNKYAVFQEYFPLNGKGEITVFHKSLLDWLKNTRLNRYNVDEYDGHRMIVHAVRLDLSREDELRIYLFSAIKLFLNMQTYRNGDILEFYEIKIKKELNSLLDNNENKLLRNRLKQLVKDYPNFEENEYNEMMLRKLDSLFIPELDIIDNDQISELNRLEELYKTDNEKWAEDYIIALGMSSYKKEFALNRALKISEILFEEDPSRWVDVYIKSIDWLIDEYIRLGNMDKAKHLQEKSLKISSKQYTKDPDIWTERYIETLNNLGGLYEKVYDFKKAEKLLQESLDISQILYKANPERWARIYIATLRRLSSAYSKNSKTSEAVKIQKLGLEILTELYQNNPSEWEENYIAAYNNLASCYLGRGDLSRATEYWNKSLNILRELYQNNKMQWAERYILLLFNIASTYLTNKKTFEFVEVWEYYSTILKENYEINPDRWAEDYVISLDVLSRHYFEEGKKEKSRRLQEDSVAIIFPLYKVFPDQWVELYIGILNHLSEIYFGVGEIENAIKVAKECYSISQKNYRSNPDDGNSKNGYIRIMKNLEQYYRETGNEEKVKEFREKIDEIKDSDEQ